MKNIYKLALDNLKLSENFDEKVKLILLTNNKQYNCKFKVHTRFKERLVGVLCAFIIIFCLMIFRSGSFGKSSEFLLHNTTGDVSVSYVNKVPSNLIDSSNNYSLSYRYTELELIEKFGVCIVKGCVTDISNIKIQLGSSVVYRSIAEIKIEKSIRMHEKIGSTIKVLLPTALYDNTEDTKFYTEDTEVISTIKKGSDGIFLMEPYDANSVMSTEDSLIHLEDIAKYGLRDGVRTAFIDTKDGLVFDRASYESISNAKKLDEIELWLRDVLNKFHLMKH